MQITSQNLQQNLNQAIKIVGQYLCWFLTRANDKVKQFLGPDNHRAISQFLQKHAFACIFGSMVMAACVFHFRTRKRAPSDIAMSSDHSKSKKSSPQKLPQKLRSKIKFASDQEPDQIQGHSQNFTTEPYESALQTKKSRRKTVPKRKKENYEDLEQALQEQVSKSREKIVLEDSKSDKIFNEMYGMYQEALR